MPITIQTTIPQKKQLGRFVLGEKKPYMAMVEVTHRCNMTCPVCYCAADSSADEDISFDDIQDSLKQLLEITETPIPLQISGGEPSLRDDLPEIISLARRLGYRHIELITNGIRIGEDPLFLQTLKKNGLSAVYLQFDGLQGKASLQIRGRDMRENRLKALTAIRKADLCCTLAVVVTRGVNDDEIGDILHFAVDNIDVVRAINFQSAARLDGRFDVGEHYRGYSMNELLELIESKTGIHADTFLGEHLGHPSCNAMSPVFVVGGELKPLFQYISKEDVFSFLGEDGREKMLATFAGKKDFFLRYLLTPTAWKYIAQAAPIFGTNPYNVLTSRHLLLFAKTFMEKDSMDEQRLGRCCYAIAAKEGVYSFCAYNNIHRFSK